ncbi:uncharacterized protein LOC123507795 isoform X1 [Portunus trituberculatus]|uniref:uncharacterized protein LOC123507795 isoform X1 n=1 Tax=Portunus trituberculatus TaxID=210409 RepID=UPI001E1D069A|nr:uncharacterized protein LOC123507795 isoform X1 [Portunus trituberculatus]
MSFNLTMTVGIPDWTDESSSSHTSSPDLSSEISFAAYLFILIGAAIAIFLFCHYRVREWVVPRLFRVWWRLHARFPWVVPRLPRRYIRAMANWLNRDAQRRNNRHQAVNGQAWPNDDVPLARRNRNR